MFQTEFNTLVNDLFRTFEPPRAAGEPKSTSAWTPAVDAYVEGEQLVLDVMLAGVDPKDVELTATGNHLTIKGTRTRKLTKDTRVLQREIAGGTFERSLELPEGIDASKAEAHFENGALQVRLPGLGAVVPRKIEIQGRAAA